MSNETTNQIRQLLYQPDTPGLRTQVCALCVKPWMLKMAEQSIPGLGVWSKRQLKIAEALELHKRRHAPVANYSECRFRMKELAKADLRAAYLSSANLSSANLRGANLSGADLSSANMFGADLRGANMFGADLRGANMFRANMFGADLFNADLRWAILEGAYLSGTQYNEHTAFPEGFDPVARDMERV